MSRLLCNLNVDLWEFNKTLSSRNLRSAELWNRSELLIRKHLEINCRHAVPLKFSLSDREKINFTLRLSHRRAGIQTQISKMQSSNSNIITTLLNGPYCIPHCHMWKT